MTCLGERDILVFEPFVDGYDGLCIRIVDVVRAVVRLEHRIQDLGEFVKVTFIETIVGDQD